MEIIPALRRFMHRRYLLCFFFLSMMFLACAFYTHFADSKSPNLSQFLDIEDFEEEIRAKPAESYVFRGNRFQLREVLNTESSDAVHQSSPDKHRLSSFMLNTSSNAKVKRNSSIQVNTKYIYDEQLSSSSTTVPSMTTASVSKVSSTAFPPVDTCSLTMEDSKLILLWTPFFEYWNYLPQSYFSQCSRCRNCRVTTDKSKLIESDAVIFHARDMSVAEMPSLRLPHQRWIFYCLESPPYSDFPGLLYADNMFNWTMTYRRDSDIHAPYGYVTKVRPPREVNLQKLEWAWSNKTRSVVWMSSHCPTAGGRDEYAAELGRYIDVDIFGSCGTSVCPKGETDKCLQEFAQKYKFFLAFENSLCKDYITEKFYRTFRYNIIPVVFGGAAYEKFSPPGSFIDALSFKSPRHLAFFLTGVGKSFKLYSKYFKWRGHYAIHLGNKKECELCSMLHNKNLKPSSYPNLRQWWVHDSSCEIWKP